MTTNEKKFETLKGKAQKTTGKKSEKERNPSLMPCIVCMEKVS